MDAFGICMDCKQKVELFRYDYTIWICEDCGKKRRCKSNDETSLTESLGPDDLNPVGVD